MQNIPLDFANNRYVFSGSFFYQIEDNISWPPPSNDHFGKWENL